MSSSEEASVSTKEGDAERIGALGLGRGINAASSQMWKQKSSLVLREPNSDLSNITTVTGTGEREYFQQIVPSWSACQEEITRAMEEQEQSLSIGTHLQFSDRFDKIAVSQKRLTRTIAFKNTTPTGSEFETRLSKFLYKQFCAVSEDKPSTVQLSPASVLGDYLKTLKQARNKSHLREIVLACREFVATTGVTHYVSALQLGALRYNTYSLSEYLETLGTGTGPVGGPLTPGVVSRPSVKWTLDMLYFSHAIGERGRGDEAVVGFDILPVYLLVEQEDLRVLLKEALIQFLQANKTLNTNSCYMIASGSDESRQIYWTVNPDNKVMGTEQKEQASQFHFMPTGTVQSPSEFLIRYDKQEKGQRTVHYFLHYDANLLGWMKEPLRLSLDMGDRFTVQGQSSYTYLCTSMTKTLQDWIEGQAFHLRCSRHSMFKMNGYVGMRPRENSNETCYTYETVGVSVFQKEDSNTRFHLTEYTRQESGKREKGDGSVVTGEALEAQPSGRSKDTTRQAKSRGDREIKSVRKKFSTREELIPQKRSRSKTISGENCGELRRATHSSRARARSSSMSGGASERQSRRYPLEQGSREGDLREAARRARAKAMSTGSREPQKRERREEMKRRTDTMQ